MHKDVNRRKRRDSLANPELAGSARADLPVPEGEGALSVRKPWWHAQSGGVRGRAETAAQVRAPRAPACLVTRTDRRGSASRVRPRARRQPHGLHPAARTPLAATRARPARSSLATSVTLGLHLHAAPLVYSRPVEARVVVPDATSEHRTGHAPHERGPQPSGTREDPTQGPPQWSPTREPNPHHQVHSVLVPTQEPV